MGIRHDACRFTRAGTKFCQRHCSKASPFFLWHLPVESHRHMTRRASGPHTASAKPSSAISLHTQDPIDALQHRLRIFHA